MTEKKLATPAEVADYLQTTVAQLAQMRYRRDGPKFVKLGRSVRYQWEDVCAYIDSQTRGGV